jgi:hypothetical protein
MPCLAMKRLTPVASSSHLPWLGLGFFVIIPVIGGLIYGPPIYRWAVIRRGRRPSSDPPFMSSSKVIA